MEGNDIAAASQQTFEYSPISSTQLRLLSYAEDSTPEDISLRIAAFEREKAPSYVALSYRWAEPTPARQIRLDGLSALVWPNLWLALSQARKTLAKTGHFWIDSLCINQKDESERNSQVRVMDQTYKRARYVAVWLGVFDEETRPLFEKKLQDFAWLGKRPLVMRGAKPLMRALHYSPSEMEVAADKIIRNLYWKRAWIVQEIFLAREVKICAGGNSIPLQVLFARVHFGLPDRPLWEQDVCVSEFNQRWICAFPPKSLTGFAPGTGKLDTMVFHLDRECSDPRDKIFALLGIMQDAEKQSLSRYFPDYGISLNHFMIVLLTCFRKHCGQHYLVNYHFRELEHCFVSRSYTRNQRSAIELEAKLHYIEVTNHRRNSLQPLSRTLAERTQLAAIPWLPGLTVLDVLDCMFLSELAPENLDNVDLREFDFRTSSGIWTADVAGVMPDYGRVLRMLQKSAIESLGVSPADLHDLLFAKEATPSLIDRICELGNLKRLDSLVPAGGYAADIQVHQHSIG